MYEILRGSYFQRLEDRRREMFEESGDPYWAAPVFFDPHHYVSILDEFVRSGQVPDAPDPWHEDYLERYLREVMADPFVVCSVLGDDIKARVFYDNMLAFMKQIFTREKFRRTCSQGQEQKMKQALQWSEHKKRDGWNRLLSEINDEFQEFGFDERKYRDKFEGEGGTGNPDDWRQMIEDWNKAFERQKQQQLQHDIDEFKDSNTRTLKQNLTQIPEYLGKRNIDKDRFYQVWGLMGGQWNTLVFEHQLRVADLQKKYPQLERIANRMGRIADDESDERMPVALGGKMKMEHAAKSDILGVALGKDIRLMLPLELAQSSDEDLYDLFLYKYATRSLQTFHHKSEMLKPSRRVAPRPARLRGPMIVCVDRSGSMTGLPEELSNSLMMKLLLIAERQHRNLFLVSFSVEARPIDIVRDRTALLEFFRQQSSGGTNAAQMLRQVFALLAGGNYSSADVLWVTDFSIPLCSEEQRRELMHYRRQGTKFYGLKIGCAFSQGWEPYFDEILSVEK